MSRKSDRVHARPNSSRSSVNSLPFCAVKNTGSVLPLPMTHVLSTTSPTLHVLDEQRGTFDYHYQPALAIDPCCSRGVRHFRP